MENRIIKFRAWDKENKEIFIPKEIIFLKNGKFNVNKNNAIGIDDWRNCELMQFTGLLDKNGKEIYEGDVIEFDYDEYHDPCGNGYPNTGKKERKEVRFILDGSQDYPFKNCEVIGNVFENENLLK
jgi:hypothetical protein